MNSCIVKMTVSSILMAEIAKIKIVQRGTEIHAEIGIMMVVGENKDVHTYIKKHMIQKEHITVKVEA